MTKWKPGGTDQGKGTTYVQAKVANEVIKVQKSKVQLEKLKDSLVDRDKALGHVFRLWQDERDSWLDWPQKAAAELSDELGVAQQTLCNLLAEGVNDHLSEMGEIQFRVD